LEAVLVKATYRASAERFGTQLSPFPCPPEEETLARDVVPVTRSWTKIS
jgi:hypothetical protein